MCHHYEREELAEWQRMVEAERDEVLREDEADPDGERATTPADD